MKVIRNLRQYGRKGRGTMERKIDSLVGNWKEDRLRYAPDVDYHERQFQNAKTAKDKNEQAKKKQSAANRRKSFFQKNPWKYIGFAKNSEERNEKQHNKHVNSSPLVMLVEATAMYTLNVAAKSYLGPYRMEWSVVAYISGPDEATPSEIIMAVISEGYWFTGAGLAIEDSGKSNDVTDLDKKWSRFSTWTGSNTKYYERMKEQNDLIETKRNLRFVIKTHEAAAEARARGGQEGVEREIKRQLLARAIIGHQTISEGGKEAPLKAGQVRTSSSDDTSKSSMDGKKSTNEGSPPPASDMMDINEEESPPPSSEDTTSDNEACSPSPWEDVTSDEENGSPPPSEDVTSLNEKDGLPYFPKAGESESKAAQRLVNEAYLNAFELCRPSHYFMLTDPISEATMQIFKEKNDDAIERLWAIGSNDLEIATVKVYFCKLGSYFRYLIYGPSVSTQDIRTFYDYLERALQKAERKHKRRPNEKRGEGIGSKAKGVMRFLRAALVIADSKAYKA
ncbi:Ankyrin repeat protein [Lasiodiplodia theobromae]|uniref:Ankyrin repeat protein n=1 Tax=Lasiodiplodia theobromae TaxID=45133 RepID=UPI0015C38DA8|nr:Ankyrin repeat protein [Lasiodiplodia theobromae]KAF4544090.1 Ankyrin repeat protein [Lasiodiplodia theobromae]